MKVLILDEESQVGAALLELLSAVPTVECRFMPSRLLANSPEGVAQRIQAFCPDFIVNTYSIEVAQSESRLSRAHLRLIRLLSYEAGLHNCVLIHLSSALVFDGARGHRFGEADRPRPKRAVSRRLLETERSVERHCERSIVLRTGWIFGAQSNAAFAGFLRRLQRGEEVVLRPGMMGAPTPAPDVARVLCAMMQQLVCGAQCRGVYHYTSADNPTSREFAETVITLSAQYGELDIDSIRLRDGGQADARGPGAQPVLICTRILNDFGIKQRPWRSAMTTILKTIYRVEAVGEDSPV